MIRLWRYVACALLASIVYAGVAPHDAQAWDSIKKSNIARVTAVRLQSGYLMVHTEVVKSDPEFTDSPNAACAKSQQKTGARPYYFAMDTGTPNFALYYSALLSAQATGLYVQLGLSSNDCAGELDGNNAAAWPRITALWTFDQIP